MAEPTPSAVPAQKRQRSPSPGYPPPKLYNIVEPEHKPSNPTSTDYAAKFKGHSEIAIVIDGGSWNTRAGWSTEAAPRIRIPPVASRYRDRKIGRTFTLVGNDAYADANSRSSARYAYDNDVVSNFDVMENLLDFVFLRLGINDEGAVKHGVVMTEALCNPVYNRKTMTELMFEAYNVPSLVYGIDSLFSYHHNTPTQPSPTGLVISSSHSSTHAIPVLNGRALIPLATRLSWGGSQATSFLSNLLQLKYPNIPSKNFQITSHVEGLMMEHCYVASNYDEEVEKYLERDALYEKDRVVQWPFTEIVEVKKSEEELERIVERRKESGRRLQEQAAKMRREKLAKKEEELEYLRSISASLPGLNKKDMQRTLTDAGYKSPEQLDKYMKELEKKVRRSRNKDLGIEEEPEEAEVPTFPLLEIPDEDLDEEGIKQKKAQRLHKAGYDARQRAKAEKNKERQRLAEIAAADDAFRESDLDAWIQQKRTAREAVLANIKERAKIKSQLTDRKSAASQMRMKAIANLASDEPSRKRRRNNVPSKGEGGDDDFGADDDDWAVYRNITTQTNEEEEEEEEELKEELKVLEAALLAHDPAFEEGMAGEGKKDWRKSMIHAFLRGVHEFDPASQAQENQMHVNIERIRVPEVIFEPSMAGVDQAGIVELTSDILLHRLSNPAEREAALKDIFLTGGNCLFHGFEDRLRRELMAVLPYQAPMGVRMAGDCLLDAWRGAAGWANKTGVEEYRSKRVTKSEYEEKGAEYIKEHRLGNVLREG